LHGKGIVVLKMGGFRNLQPRNQGQAHLTTKEPKGIPLNIDFVATFEPGDLNVEEINKLKSLKSFLTTIQIGSYSLAQIGTCLNFR